MANILDKKSNALFSVIIILLMAVCVGLLVAVMKGTMTQELASQAKAESRRDTTSVLAPPEGLTTREVRSLTTSPQTVGSTSNGSTSTEGPPYIVYPWDDFRLPAYIVPLHYELSLEPRLIEGIFYGQVKILVNISEPTNMFIVHAYQLTVNVVKIFKRSDGSRVAIKDAFPYEKNQFWVVLTEQALPVHDSYELFFSFEGSLVKGFVGFYRSSYFNAQTNETRYLAATKFQPTYARRAFPCFDEPNFKSSFRVSIIHDEAYEAISNTPIEEYRRMQNGSNMMITTFQTSVPMVTYLAAFIVCDFNYTRIQSSSGVQIRVYATPAQVHKTKYSLQITAKMLDYFERYFNISYPLPKLDLIALPDFVSGAMENWGLITFRETNLLYNETESSPANKQRVAEVVSHELVHMWFGNLMTMKWWNDLWLNEGFASYIKYIGVHHAEPYWDMMNQYVSDLQYVMNLDSKLSSHPIVQPVSHPDEITEIFDAISYQKGASVLRMLEFVIGEGNFRQGISNFLKKYAYSNAETEDLWQEITEVLDKQNQRNVSEIMSSWTNQMGFPVITVRRDQNNCTRFTVKQERFLVNPKATNLSITNDYVWDIPLSYITSTGISGLEWIQDKLENELVIPVSRKDWVKFNVNQTGYYIVNYDMQDWDKIIEILINNHEQLTPADRSNLIYDAFKLAAAGQLSYDIPLSMTLYLKNERHLVPWKTAAQELSYLQRILEFTEVNPYIRNYIRELTSPLYNDLGWVQTGNHLENLLRSKIITLACTSGNPECLSEAVKLLEDWMYGDDLPPNLRNLVYKYGMSEGGREYHWNYMWNRYLKEGSAQEKRKLFLGLAQVKEPWLLKRYLDYAFDEDKIRTQDFFTVLGYIANNPVGRSLAWMFIREKWPDLVQRFTLNDRYLGRIVGKIVTQFTTEFQLQEVEDFFRKHPEAGAGARSRVQAIETLKNNIKWIENYKNIIYNWFTTEGFKQWLTSRLPLNVEPVHYDLTLWPRINEGNYSGQVTITVVIKEPTDSFILHASNLDIISVQILDIKENKVLPLRRVFGYNPNEFLVIQLEQEVDVHSELKLNLEFSGIISDSAVGIYRVNNSQDTMARNRYLLATNFQPSYARRAFPCFDEPTFKSTFSITVIHNGSYTILSNMLEQGTDDRSDGLIETNFRRSAPMSTYTVAIVMCDFEYKGAYTNGGTRFRVYGSPERTNATQYALDIGIKLLTTFEKHFDVRYPLPKQDMVSIPNLPIEAMDSWGLTIYKDSVIEFDEKEQSSFEQFKITNLIGHQLAHMWLGNLVTLKWWNDIWLFEALATYFSYRVHDVMEPDLNSMDEFIIEEMYPLFEPDAKISARAISTEIKDPNEIHQVFDYNFCRKGAVLLRMLESMVGKDIFQKTVLQFVKKHHHRNADSSDLWHEISAMFPEKPDIESLMKTWSTQAGYPVVNVRRDPTDATLFHLQQSHFLIDPDAHQYNSQGHTWKIPVNYRSPDSQGKPLKWLSSHEETSVHVEISDPTKWVKFNVNNTGFYLVNYGYEDWYRLVSLLAMDHKALSPVDRANLLNDAFLLARAGHISYNISLDMTVYLHKEQDLLPWKAAEKSLQHISRLLQESTEAHELMQKYIETLSKEMYLNFTWNDVGDYQKRQLRGIIIEMSCANRYENCLVEASNHLHRWLNGETIPPNLRGIVYRYGIWNKANETVWEYMWEKYRRQTSPHEKTRLLSGLAFTSNSKLIERYIENIEDETKFSKEEFIQALQLLSSNPKGRPIVWKYIKTHWTKLEERYSLSGRHIGNLIKNACGYFDTDEMLKEMTVFFSEHQSIEGAGKYREEAMENVRENIRWLQKYKATVTDWLKRKVHP